MMKKRSRMILPAALFLACSAVVTGCAGSGGAASGTVKVENVESQVISVSGSETVKVVPDMAEILYSVYSQASDAETCQTQNSTDLNRVIDLLKQEGVAETSIQTSNYGMNPIYDWENGKSIAGYEMTTRITVSDIPLEQVGKLLADSVDAGINSIDSVSYFSSRYDEAYDEALARAVEAARRKAEVMAEAGGCTLGEVVSIQESRANQQVRYDGYTARNASAKLEAAADMAVMPGELEVEADITVEFAIR